MISVRILSSPHAYCSTDSSIANRLGFRYNPIWFMVQSQSLRDVNTVLLNDLT